jgi:aminoglycoside phosphotransferase
LRLDYDRAVPQRDLMLDPELVAARLGPLLPLELEACHRLRVKYRIGARLRVLYRIRAAGSGSYDVTASTFPSLERSERAYAHGLEHSVASGPLPPVVQDRELTTVYWTFPNDRKIAGLPALARPEPELVELLPGWCRSELAGYAPEKAATVRCLDETGRTVGYAKAYAGQEGSRARRVHDALTRALGADDPLLRLPQALAYSPRHRTLIVESLDWDLLHAGDAFDLRDRYRRLGRALARFHELPRPDSLRFRRADPDRLDAAAELIASVRGDVAAAARRLARELRPLLAGDGGDVCLHGDVNFRNALLDNGRVTLIDLDQVASGPAAAELGSVLASLRYAGVVGLLSPSLVPDLCASLLRGYEEVRPAPSAAALRAHTAAALLGERALRVVTRVRPEGLRGLPTLFAHAREAVG